MSSVYFQSFKSRIICDITQVKNWKTLRDAIRVEKTKPKKGKAKNKERERERGKRKKFRKFSSQSVHDQKEVTVFRVFLRSQQIRMERESARAEQKAERNSGRELVRATRRALKTPLKASLRLPSDIFCQSGHSLCRICQRTRTCPAGQKIRVIVRFLSTCYVFSTGTRHFLHGKPRPSAAVTRLEQRSKTFPAFPTPCPSFFPPFSRRKFKILFRSQFAWIQWIRRNSCCRFRRKKFMSSRRKLV